MATLRRRELGGTEEEEEVAAIRIAVVIRTHVAHTYGRGKKLAVGERMRRGLAS